jgi:cell division protein FtsW (lipid II flippase)
VSFFAVENATPIDEKQGRLMQLAALFLLFFSLLLSLSPAARLNSWEADYRWNHWIGFVTWLIGAAFVHHQLVRRAPDRDPYLFPVVALLSGWGMLTVWRLDTLMGARQTAWLALSLLALGFGLRIPDLLGLLRRYKYLWLTGGLLLTAATFLFGTYPGGEGPHLWLGCCGVYLQPSEPLKLLLIVYLAAYLADRLPLSFTLPRLIVPTLILAGAALALLAIQRDLGTASLFILIYSIVVYLASQRRRMLLVSLFILLIAGAAGYGLFDVVRIRVDAWLNPWLDSSGRSYQIVQSLLAIASGGLVGRGPGLGSPGVVPVAHSDFIYASIVEETGLPGALGLLLLYGLLVGRGFRAAICALNNYQRYLSAGITTYLVLQAIFIIGGNLRMLPLTGVTLPFVSYGGSSLLTASIATLILLQASNRGEEEPAPLPNPRPYLLVSSGLLAGLAALALFTGWWTAARRDGLVGRIDNPRRAIGDRYVPRGSLLDRNNLPIARSGGVRGQIERIYEHLPLSPTIGYNSPLYGQAGLEAGLDAELRGMRSLPEVIWFNDLFYGQRPPGFDVRLSIDLELQRQVDALLGEHTGALVLLNAETGEILSIASHPYFDPMALEENWPALIQDPGAPLINRATQGQYPPGAALGPFFLAYLYANAALPPVPEMLEFQAAGNTWACALEPSPPLTPGNMVAGGCPGPLVFLAREIGPAGLEALFASLGFYKSPALALETAIPSAPGIGQVDLAALGQDNLAVTPLQMSLAAAALTNQGARPAPQLATAVLDPQAGWTNLPNGSPTATVLGDGARKALIALAQLNSGTWETLGRAVSEERTLTWFLAGTLPDRQGPSLALALILEEDAPEQAKEIGRAVLLAALE